jgi:hypothetical protein
LYLLSLLWRCTPDKKEPPPAGQAAAARIMTGTSPAQTVVLYDLRWLRAHMTNHCNV